MYKKAKYFISGNQIIKTELFDIKELEKGFSIYEVVKITKGIPVFIEDHLERFHHSAKLKLKKIYFSNSEIEGNIKKLIKINNINEGRLKFLIHYHSSGNKLILFFLNPINPSQSDYTNGVNINLFQAERPNPNAKIINYKLRTVVNKLIRENKIFEVLFYNTENIISECSKSNIFFIKNDTVYTSFSKNILPGITREYIYKICSEHCVTIRECEINISDLQSFDSVFITGTSLGVLPVKMINSYSYTVSDKIINLLSTAYKDILETYISAKIKYGNSDF